MTGSEFKKAHNFRHTESCRNCKHHRLRACCAAAVQRGVVKATLPGYGKKLVVVCDLYQESRKTPTWPSKNIS
jgi:hypothetical protein